MLANEWDSVQLAEWGLDVWQNDDDVIIDDDNTYTKKIETPMYEPKNKKPTINQLYNIDKTNQLIDKIKDLKLNKAEQDFLISAAYRHIVFNYNKIADYYAHSDKEVQELMEQSALVIIDFDKAIENGYVSLSDDIEKAYTLDYE
jgi:hypothetical protein